MSRHDSAAHRCPTCRMHRSMCLCALLPRLETRTHLLLVIHQLETHKTTNTGRVAALCLPQCRVLVRGRADGAAYPAAAGASAEAAAASAQPPALWSPETQPLLLFPHEGSTPLEDWVATPRPLTLIVPDGTWSQAIRARKRIPGLAEVPCARLPDSAALAADRFRLRHDGRPGRLSTLAAIAIALGVLEGPAVQQALERVLAIMIDRTLWTNGRLRTADVTGGIPAGALPHDPLGRQGARRPV